MPDQLVPVPYGALQATQLNPNLPEGTLIVNNDPTNSVWVSPEPGMAPGAGQRLGPKGSLTWSTSQRAYAILDASASAGVLLSLTSSSGNINNPVDIGVAVAKQVNAQGIPNVFQTQQLASYQLGPGIGFNLDNIGQYASIVVVANPVGGSGAVIRLDWSQVTPYNALTGANATEFLTSVDSVAFSFIIPVAAASLFVTNANPNTSLQIAVYGTNRPVPNTQQYGGTYQPRRFASNSAVLTAGQTAGVTPVDGGPNSTAFNRSMYFQFTPVNVSCQLYMSYLRMDGSSGNIQIVGTTASGVTVTGVLPHPVGLVGYTLLPTTNSTTAAVTLYFMQNVMS